MLNSCRSEDIEDYLCASTRVVSSIIQEEFDWENADFMPTPVGVTPIPTPWIGQGSLVGTYDLDVINDRKKSEGWCLLYNSFSTDPENYQQNPFFILYNEYRGIMRIFYYVTDSFIQTSSNVVDNLSIISSFPVKMLNFADKEIVKGSDTRTSLQHIQLKPFDGSLPLASQRWYMAQYELAYNPDIESIPYNQIAFNFNLSFIDITNVKLNGTSVSELKGTIGEQSVGEFSHAFNATLKEGGKAALANISYSFLKNGVKNGKNIFGIKDSTYQKILKKMGDVASGSISGVWGAAVGLLNSIFFGTKTSPTPIYATINTAMKAEGELSQEGSFPAMPITFYMPGTQIPSNAPGRLPIYNKPLGIFNINSNGLDVFVTHTKRQRIRHDDPYNPGAPIIESWETLTCGQIHDYSVYLQFNPEVEKIADINILQQEVFAMDKSGYIYNKTEFQAYNSGEQGAVIEEIPDVQFYIYFAIEVKPKNDCPSTIISKTFYLNNIVRYDNQWLPELN